MLLVNSLWVPCDGLASHPGGAVISLANSCIHWGGGGEGELVMLLVTSCWVPCDGLASHPGGGAIILVTPC